LAEPSLVESWLTFFFCMKDHFRRLITVATCSLNQAALDFEGNLKRSKESFRLAKEAGATFRLGPELELCGYGCNDHFFEPDTVMHCFEVLKELLLALECQDILGDVGMPVIHVIIENNDRMV
jgi:NAD+ synthase (glutamine-hydrolysing)